MSPHRRPVLTLYHWECGPACFETVAVSMGEAFERASVQADRRGLGDCPLRCVDSEPYDASGGDGDDE